nr:replication initiator [Haloglycomyces albus]
MHPIKLRGGSTITHRASGNVLRESTGSIWIPCGTRRESMCETCSAWYAQDAFHLIRSGLTGDADKGVAVEVAERPRWFVTLTAPSFGSVHSRSVNAHGKMYRPCSCGSWHSETYTRLGHPVDPDTYDYDAAVLWQAHAGKLWHRFTIRLKRALARIGGIRIKDLSEQVRLSYAKVAEFQRRGLVHFHGAVRLDGPDGADSTPPSWATKEALESAIRTAVADTEITTVRPDGTELALQWGTQVDLRDITAEAKAKEGLSGQALAGYIAKYATKSTGATDGADRKFRSEAEIDLVSTPAHYEAMMRTAWRLGGLVQYEHLNLRRWAHMLGFRGHFLTKSRAWSLTFGQLRDIRARHCLLETLSELDVAEDDVTVVNDWHPVGFGHRDEAEREYASAIAEQLLQKRLSKHTRQTTNGTGGTA